MACSRALLPAAPPPHDALTAAMVGIGMAFAVPAPAEEPNIEDTLLYASIEAIDHHYLRVLAVLVTWFGVQEDEVASPGPPPSIRNGHSPVTRWLGEAPDTPAGGQAALALRSQSALITAAASNARPGQRQSGNSTNDQWRPRTESLRVNNGKKSACPSALRRPSDSTASAVVRSSEP